MRLATAILALITLPCAQTPHQKAKRTMLRDKLSFVLGNIIVVVTAYWVGRSPSTLYRLYSLLTVILLGGRFFVYRKEKTHYFLFDFCYAANFVGVILLWALPRFIPLWIAPVVLKVRDLKVCWVDCPVHMWALPHFISISLMPSVLTVRDCKPC